MRPSDMSDSAGPARSHPRRSLDSSPATQRPAFGANADDSTLRGTAGIGIDEVVSGAAGTAGCVPVALTVDGAAAVWGVTAGARPGIACSDGAEILETADAVLDAIWPAAPEPADQVVGGDAEPADDSLAAGGAAGGAAGCD
jgi:hypothetical protein